MKKVAICQRVDDFTQQGESRDALDVRWGWLLWHMHLLPLPMCSAVKDPFAYVWEIAPGGIILTGGGNPGEYPERDSLEKSLLDYAATTRVPVLGICRGLQVISLYQGGQGVRVQGHVACRHNVSGELISGSREVNSYHNYSVSEETPGDDLKILARAEDGTVEALGHASLPWLAIMWHPERDDPLHANDLKLIAEHLGGWI